MCSGRMSMKWISVLLLLQLSCQFSPGGCGKVLVWPTEYSHWINMKIILDELVQRGHEVTVLTSTASILIKANTQSAIKFEIYPASFTKEDLEFVLINLISKWTNDLPKDTFWTYFSLIQEMFWEAYDFIEKLCKDVVLNKKLMTKLQQEKFDVILADAIVPCGELLAELLEIPFVYSLRFFPGYVVEKQSGRLPFPPSYAPTILSELSDQMTFIERVKNMVYVLYFDFWFQLYNQKKPDQFYSDVLGRPTTLFELMGKAEMWLIRTYWDFEFPRPLLPHFEFVGGLHCKPAKPLPKGYIMEILNSKTRLMNDGNLEPPAFKDQFRGRSWKVLTTVKEMEQFVQSSGEDGIVVFSLGSMVSNLTEEKANMIASALAQIPQKVIWRYGGKKPDMLGPNTRLYKWIPQNDLLGHPKTKAFVTHGGVNGIYEAIYHGIPMVGLPLFADQPDNIVRMKKKGAAVRLDIKTMSSADLLKALKTVINDPSYKENAMKLSRIHHDQPMKPLDRAVFWIEFVMRHKGAKHLRPASYNLNWFQYHSLDVIGFLLACVATAILVVTKCVLFCCRKFTKTGKKDKRE